MKLADYLKVIPLQIPLLRLLFPKNELSVLFEIGACEGEDTFSYSRLFPDSNCFVFEPHPSNSSLVRDIIRREGLANVHFFEAAIGDRDHTATLHISSGRPDWIADESEWDYGNKASSLLKASEWMKNFYSWLKFEKMHPTT